MSEIYRTLRKLEDKKENSIKRKAIVQDSSLGEQNDHVESFGDEAQQLQETISTLEAEWGVLSQERAKLQEELQESRSRLHVLSQEVVAKDKRLEEVERNHQSLVQKLEAEIGEKAERIVNLEKEIENLGGEHKQKVESLEEQIADRGREAESLRTEADQLRQTVSALETRWEAFHQERADLKGQMQEWRSRLQTLSQEVAARDKSTEKVQNRKTGPGSKEGNGNDREVFYVQAEEYFRE